MTEFQIIPAVDLRQGQCVRLLKGKRDQETVYGNEPVRMARRWEDQGAGRLHIIDLDGAFEGESENKPVIKQMIRALDIPCQVGGGIRSHEAVEQLLEAGADRVIIGTAGIKNPAFLENLVDRHGPEPVVAGVDCRDEEVLASGWEEGSELNMFEWADRLEEHGVRRTIYTNIERDGTEEGPDVDRTRELVERSNLRVVASGGVGSLDHLRSLARLDLDRLEGVIVGRALYEGTFDIPEAQAAIEEVRS